MEARIAATALIQVRHVAWGKAGFALRGNGGTVRAHIEHGQFRGAQLIRPHDSPKTRGSWARYGPRANEHGRAAAHFIFRLLALHLQFRLRFHVGSLRGGIVGIGAFQGGGRHADERACGSGHLDGGLLLGLQFVFAWASSNMNSLSMEPLGAVAGTAAAVFGFMQTVGGAIIGTFIGQQFNGSTIPNATAWVVMGVMVLGCVLIAEKGKLFGVGAEYVTPPGAALIE